MWYRWQMVTGVTFFAVLCISSGLERPSSFKKSTNLPVAPSLPGTPSLYIDSHLPNSANLSTDSHLPGSASPPILPTHHHPSQPASFTRNPTKGSRLPNCISGSGDVTEVMLTPQKDSHYLLNVSSEFQYLQVSMKLGSCFLDDVYRGNRYVTKDTVGSLPTQANLKLVYERLQDGTHTYHLALKKFAIDDTINTSVKCGDFLGFRIKAKGVSVCHLHWEENRLGVVMSSARTQEKSDVSLQRLSEIYHWAKGAYLMAICFTLVAYVLLLVAGRVQKRRQYAIVEPKEDV